MDHHLITLMVFFPVLGALLQAFVPTLKGMGAAKVGRVIALFASLSASICAIALVVTMTPQTADLQQVEVLPWVGSYAMTYNMAVDGLNALLVLLIAILFPILIASEWNQKIGPRGMHGLFLILQTALFGAVCAQDLFLMFFFWGLSAIPFYFLIGIWGEDGRERAAVRTVIAAILGNALMFAALVLIYYSVDPHTFSLQELSGGKLAGKTFEFFGSDFPVSVAAFSLIVLGLALRAPIWPLHGWFTQAAEEAPSSVFVALSAATVPVATYIFIRVSYTLFPETISGASEWIVIVGTINLLVGGLCALGQRGLHLLLAYLCLTEVGLVLIGIGSLNPAGLVGAVYQQLVLGLGLAGFGLFTGLIADRMGHTHFLTKDGERNLGGIATRAPMVAVVAGLVIGSLLGLPGFAGFVGHSLLMIGGYSVHPVTVVLTGVALLVAAYYLFTMYRFVFLGRPSANMQGFEDLSWREKAYLLPILAGLLFFGLYPKPMIELIRPTVLTLLSTVK